MARTNEPVLAVLPFVDRLPVLDDSLIGLGLHEDVCAALARFPTLKVISALSAAAVAELTDAEIGSRLGASHVLRGRLASRDGMLRLDTNLIETQTATHVWSERLEVAREEVFDMETDMVARVAGTLVKRLEDATLAQSARKPAETFAAHEATLRGLLRLRDGTLDGDEAARRLFEQALETDPHYARAHAGLALSYFNEWSCMFWDCFEANGAAAYRHAHRALELDERDALPHVIIGKVLLYRREFEKAGWYYDRALTLSPHDPQILTEAVNGDVFLGRPELAVTHVELAMKLNPYHPNDYHASALYAYLFARDFERAVESFRRLHSTPIIDIPACVAVACAHLDRLDEGRAHLAEFDRLYSEKILFGGIPETGETLEWLLKVSPLRRPEDCALVVDGFARLGTQMVAKAQPQRDSSTRAALRRSGSGWQVDFLGICTFLPDLKGIGDIRRLVAQPEIEIHCLDLAGREPEGDLGAILDDKARSALKSRIRDLQEDLAEAEDYNDIGRTEQLRGELDALIEAMAQAVGLGGRSRRLGDLAERARSTVTWRVRHAIRRIEIAHPALGRHLANSLRTGTFCVYRPESPLEWHLSD